MADIFKLSKLSYIAIFGTSIGTFSSGILEPTIAPYLEILGLSSKEIGSILAARFLMTAILSIPFAMISSRIGEVKILQMSSIFLISSVFFLRYVEGSDGVYYFFIVVGLASASSSGPTAAILANNSGDKRVAAFALYSITWMIPPAIGSAISAYWFQGVISYNIQSLSSIFIVVFYSAIGLGVLYFILLIKTKTDEHVEDKEKFTVRREFQILLSPLILLPFTSLMLVNFLSGSGAGATLPFLPPYLKKLGAIPTELSLLVLILNLSMGVATQFVTPLVKKFGDIPVFVATTSLSTLCLVGLAFSEDLQLASIFFILRGTFANMNAPISTARIFSYIDNRVRATGSAVGSNIRWIGYVIASPISGNIIDNQGYEVSFVFTAIIYIISMILFVWTVKTKPDLETLLKRSNVLDTGYVIESNNEQV